ncbi:helix-turn-helix domain-containing protein [Reichenbachiella versicolor]|uniref:helix-turn-helix domain-containing protein n=1 Tax=Reichenbachiella versicolor TaxID=1821036 RepID=UPI001FE8A1E7|nr:AraC family transcriptional regulator [Reichenbachiella versicolor]
MNTVCIKNMVCPRCIEMVCDIFKSLEIEILHIDLGEVKTAEKVKGGQKVLLENALRQKGFELLEDKASRLIASIKSIIINQIHHKEEGYSFNYSTLLSEKLGQDYSSLSKVFSSTEGITIEKYIIKQKIEKVKELIVYNELNLSEIAINLNYSSVAHLSAQFKKETGMTPSHFKKLGTRNRQSLDSI